jgi:predicted RNA-binding Zn-ribbon protein involved in translation (DUF1610 family)
MRSAPNIGLSSDNGINRSQNQRYVMKINMKIETTWRSLLICSSVALALVLSTIGTVQAQEKGSAKGGATQLMSKPVKTLEDLSALQPGDMMVMSCPKCKNVTVSYVEPTFKAMEPKEKVKTEHTCPSCGTTTTVEGHGKAKKDIVKHVCKSCGSKDAFCCVVKKGSGPTKGMQKDAK